MEIKREKGGEKMEMIVERNFGVWNQALLSKDKDVVANLYTQDATFLPTLSPDFKMSRDGAKEYFEHFLQKDPSGRIIKEAVQTVPIGTVIHSGLYEFEVGQEGKREVLPARFTFIWQPDGKIIHHHSSLVPQSRIPNGQGESLFQQEPETKMAGKFFSKWAQALLSKDKDVVANLYTQDATFLPTLSPDFKMSRDGAKEYFEHFLQKDPSGRIIKEAVQTVPIGTVIHSGLYEFEVGQEGKREVLPARFTFIWQPDGKIIHHHSSLQPVIR